MPATTITLRAQAAYVPGYVIADKYVLERELGEGGMGVVWQARNIALDAPVAIKLLRTDESRQILGSRLLKEARAAARLGHAAIVRVFDLGHTEGGDPFLVMELLNGQSLGTVLEEGPLVAQRAVQLLLPIADALSVAHAKGFVHRDLKPDNVFVSENDGQVQPKLLDFGIVKVREREEERKLTQLGVVLGSPDYMSPEQARGLEDIDARSDIWSFCVTLYQAVSGFLPFEGNNYNELVSAIVESDVAPLSSSECDPELFRIITRGLAKAREARFQSMNELGRELSQWLKNQGVNEDACGKPLERHLGGQEASAHKSKPPPGECTIAGVPARDHAANPTTVKPVSIEATPEPKQEARGSQQKTLLIGLASGVAIAGVFVALRAWHSESGGEIHNPSASAAETAREVKSELAVKPASSSEAITVSPADETALAPNAAAPAARPAAANDANTRRASLKPPALAPDAGTHERATPANSADVPAPADSAANVGSLAPANSATPSAGETTEAETDPAEELINAY